MTARRHIAFISSCSELWGGSEELWFEAACALASEGHRVDVYKTRVDRDHPRIRELEALGCKVTDLSRPGPQTFWHAAHSPLAARFAIPLQLALAAPRLLFPRRPDLVVVSQGGNFDGTNFGRLCQKIGLPFVMVSQKASPFHWPPDAARTYIRTIHEAARRSVFVSHHNVELTRLQLDTDLPRAAVIHNPVLAGAGGALPWPQDDGITRLACIGRLWLLEKGQDLLFEVLSAPKWRERPIEVGVYGQGLNREGIEGLVRRLDLKQVAIRGYVDDIDAVWATHHGLLLTSRTEGLPLVVQEAMACGRVPIVTDAGGTGELVQDEHDGFVAAAPAVTDIDDALERAWARRADWPAIGLAGAEKLERIRAERGHAPLATLVLEELGASAGRRVPRPVQRLRSLRRRSVTAPL